MLEEIVDTAEAFDHILKYAKRPSMDERNKFMRAVSLGILALGGIVFIIHVVIGMLLGTL